MNQEEILKESMQSLVPLDFYITKASQDPETGEMRWMATASDTLEDSKLDEMSQQLYDSFLHKIKNDIPAPEPWQTEYWKGGKPYLSVSHYSDGNGKSVPGSVEQVYKDGGKLKAKGTFADTPLGVSAFSSVRESIKQIKAGVKDFEPVRISIGFLDFAHKHKSSGFEFVRESISDICLECLRERLGGVIRSGLVYQDGQLIHLALTRVPVNERTSIEVDRSDGSMVTRKDDAASIVGDANADELEEVEKELIEEMQRPEKALVIKSEEPVEEVMAEEVEVIEEVVPEPMVEETPVVETTPHVLDGAIADFKAVFDGLDKSNPKNAEQLQESMNSLALVVQSQFGKGTPDATAPLPDFERLISEAVAKAMTQVSGQIATLSGQVEQLRGGQPVAVQRSITAPSLIVNDPAQHRAAQAQQPQKKVSALSQLINRSVGLPDDFVRSGASVQTG